MPLSVTINFNGNCREAATFYARVFGCEPPRFTTYAELDTSFDPNVKMSAGSSGLIAHTALTIAGSYVEMSDMPDNFQFQPGNNYSLRLELPIEEARTAFNALAEDGQAFVPFADIPGQGWYGMLADKFGTSWMIHGV